MSVEDCCNIWVVCKGFHDNWSYSMNDHNNRPTTVRGNIFHKLLTTLLQEQVIPITLGVLRRAKSC